MDVNTEVHKDSDGSAMHESIVNDDSNEKVESVISVLLCERCKVPITSYDDILTERESSAWAEQVYAYELELFADKPPLWCYSATNPSDRRFDLLRCSAAAVTTHRTVKLSGPWSNKHSFFVGYQWAFAACAICGNFLGWGFSKLTEGTVDVDDQESNNGQGDNNCVSESVDVSGDADAEINNDSGDEEANTSEDDEDSTAIDFDSSGVSYVGLIITHCVGRNDYPLAKYNELISIDCDRRRWEAFEGEYHSARGGIQGIIGAVLNIMPPFRFEGVGEGRDLGSLALQLAQSPFGMLSEGRHARRSDSREPPVTSEDDEPTTPPVRGEDLLLSFIVGRALHSASETSSDSDYGPASTTRILVRCDATLVGSATSEETTDSEETD